MNVTEPVTFECIATGIPPPTIEWFRGDMLLAPEEAGSGQNLVLTPEEAGSGQNLISTHLHLMLSEPSQMLVPTPSGNIYQVERTLTFNTNGSDSDLYACVASNVNQVQQNATQDFALYVLGRSRNVQQELMICVPSFFVHQLQ